MKTLIEQQHDVDGSESAPVFIVRLFQKVFMVSWASCFDTNANSDVLSNIFGSLILWNNLAANFMAVAGTCVGSFSFYAAFHQSESPDAAMEQNWNLLACEFSVIYQNVI